MNEKLKSLSEKHGTRKLAIKLIDVALNNYSGLSSCDLPDTCTYANGIDSVEELLITESYTVAVDEAKGVAEEMLIEEGFPLN